MKDPKALKEVWEWKDKAYWRIKGLSTKSRFAYINKKAATICRSHRLRLSKAEYASP